MTETNETLRARIDDHLLDEFIDAETEMGWGLEHTRSLQLLLVDVAIIVAVIALGLWLG